MSPSPRIFAETLPRNSGDAKRSAAVDAFDHACDLVVSDIEPIGPQILGRRAGRADDPDIAPAGKDTAPTWEPTSDRAAAASQRWGPGGGASGASTGAHAASVRPAAARTALTRI